jgi:hypothetical protein
MNSHIIKFGSKGFEIPESLEIGNDYLIAVKGSLTGISKDDNHDGSFTFTNKMELTEVELTDKTGKTIKSKDTRKQSQKLRGQIIALGMDYDATMTDLRRFLPEVIGYVKTLKENL